MTSPTTFAARTYDYLVLGGGTAGLVVAARLSEDPHITVGVLEAGAPAALDDLAINVPGRYGEGIGTHRDWQYETTPQPGLGGRSLPWPRGKVLGGTSALNFMAWNRPAREDLDAWAELGNEGWGWDDVEPFYRKSEHFHPPTDADTAEHKLHTDVAALGTQGPVPVSYLREYSVSHRHWHATLNNLGVQTNERHLSGSNVGVWTNVVAVDPEKVTRSSAATAYYAPNRGRKNLVVLTGASVREIVLEREGEEWVAKGVRFEHDGSEFVAKASREVILSAGSVASPQILELSGIGNPAVLDAAKIPVKVANPNVGEHVQDHMMTATIFEIDPSTATGDDLKTDPILAAAADRLYTDSQSGPRTMLPGSFAYLPLADFLPAADLAHLTDLATDLPQTPTNTIRARRLSARQNLGAIEYIFDVGNWSPFHPATPGKRYATLLQILQYPFSHGSIHLDPSDPTGSPLIDPKYYAGPHGELDLEIQRLCAEHIGRKITSTPPLSGMILRRASPAEGDEHGTGEGLRDWTVANTITDWHPIGSCAMGGALGIAGGVVDARLCVYGVKGLRLVDASVMPLQISAHLQATVYAIGEKGAAMIREDQRGKAL
ncbi:hypothetical protein LTR53_006853 [Teratosphaeriaceae sp. CCFEE 6253]|nr:hypothetical protein LTR53_006853 [Teratosphaeriaceae sp. CCFEE 6253]